MTKRIILSWGRSKPPEKNQGQELYDKHHARRLEEFRNNNPVYPGMPFRDPYYAWEHDGISDAALYDAFGEYVRTAAPGERVMSKAEFEKAVFDEHTRRKRSF